MSTPTDSTPASPETIAGEHREALRFLGLVFSSYITESKHPECLPSMRWRAVCPDGLTRFFPTFAAAYDYLSAAVGMTTQEGKAK